MSAGHPIDGDPVDALLEMQRRTAEDHVSFYVQELTRRDSDHRSTESAANAARASAERRAGEAEARHRATETRNEELLEEIRRLQRELGGAKTELASVRAVQEAEVNRKDATRALSEASSLREQLEQTEGRLDDLLKPGPGQRKTILAEHLLHYGRQLQNQMKSVVAERFRLLRHPQNGRLLIDMVHEALVRGVSVQLALRQVSLSLPCCAGSSLFDLKWRAARRHVKSLQKLGFGVGITRRRGGYQASGFDYSWKTRAEVSDVQLDTTALEKEMVELVPAFLPPAFRDDARHLVLSAPPWKALLHLLVERSKDVTHEFQKTFEREAPSPPEHDQEWTMNENGFTRSVPPQLTESQWELIDFELVALLHTVIDSLFAFQSTRLGHHLELMPNAATPQALMTDGDRMSWPLLVPGFQALDPSESLIKVGEKH